jgi:ribose transport system substrate-binding protein
MKRAMRIAAFGTVLALAASACGDDDTTSTTAAPGATPAATAAAGEGDGAAASEVEAAKAAYAPFLEPPASLNQTVPLTGKVDPDQTYVFLQCELPQCVEIGVGAIEAAKAIGWKTEVIQWSTADLQTMLTAMDEALAFNPVAVTLTGIPQELWADRIPAYEAAGAMIIPIAVANLELSDTVPMGAAMSADYEADGALIGNWFIADSNAEGKALVVDLPAYPVLTAHGIGFKDTVAAGCTKCTISSLDVTVPQLANGEYVPSIISALQKDPSIKYVITTNGAFIDGLSAALDAASIEGVKIAGGSATINNLTALDAGTEHAWAGEAIRMDGWIAIDIAARKLLGMDIEDSGGRRTQQLFIKGNVGTPTASLDKPDDFREQFMALWGVS